VPLRPALIFGFFLAAAFSACAQQSPKPVQDNSFLLEEAYNQEPGVVQHISSFTHSFASDDWTYTFTQEWPVPRHARHQLSFTIPVVSPGDVPAAGPGFGDLALNYRYQLLGSGTARLAFAPRLSLLVSSGDHKVGRGFGGNGVQTNLPLSLVVNRRLVTHFNLGTTLVPNARNQAGDRAALHGYNLGQSFIFQANPRFNLMLETVWAGTETVVAPRQTQRSHQLLLSPGARWAFDFSNGLQIVPGIAVPLGAGPSAGEKGLLLYLSFEHPLWQEKER
jgi:hypothetical protein